MFLAVLCQSQLHSKLTLLTLQTSSLFLIENRRYKYGQTVGRNFLGRLNTGIHQSIQMAIADKVLIDDFTQHVELFSSKEQQMTEEKYLHTERDYLDLLLAVKKKFDYQRSIVPYIIN